MPYIDDEEFPDLLLTAKEMARSLRIGIGYLRKLEERGLPYYQLAHGRPNHRYDPLEVWDWFRHNITHKGGM